MKMRLVAGFVTSLLAFSAHANADGKSQVAPGGADKVVPLEIAAAPIRSQGQLRDHLKRHPGDSPLIGAVASQ